MTMYQQDKHQQMVIDYRRFVYGTSFWMSVGFAIGGIGLAGVIATFILALYGYPPPTFAELTQAMFWQTAVAMFFFWFMFSVLVQSSQWIINCRKPQEPQQTAVPRPIAPRNVQETRRLTSQMAMGRNECFPVFSNHYKALYLRLQRNKWKITKRILNFEVGTVKVFPNIGEKYMTIVKEWNRLGFIDGYVQGEAREKWFLSEAGQAKFAELGGVREASTSPTEND